MPTLRGAGATLAPPLLALALVAVAAGPGRADEDLDPDTEIARTHFQRGQGLYAEGSYEAAAREFELARTAKPLPALEYNIARCYDRLDRPERAVEGYRAYLRVAPAGEDGDEVRRRIRILEQRIEERRRLFAPPPATSQEAPATAIATPPQEVRAPPPARSGRPPPPPPPPLDEPPPRAAAAEEERAAQPPRPRRPRAPSYGATPILAVGIVSLGAALATGIFAHTSFTSLQGRCSSNGFCSHEGAEAELAQGRTLALATDVLLGVGGAVTAVGVGLLIAERVVAGRRERQAGALAPLLLADGGGLVITWPR